MPVKTGIQEVISLDPPTRTRRRGDDLCVIPAQAGVQGVNALDPGLRRGDEEGAGGSTLGYIGKNAEPAAAL